MTASPPPPGWRTRAVVSYRAHRSLRLAARELGVSHTTLRLYLSVHHRGELRRWGLTRRQQDRLTDQRQS